MTVMETKDLSGANHLPTLEWSDVEQVLGSGFTQAPGAGGPSRHTCWLATVNPDGSPHVTGVGSLWLDGTFWFVSGDGTRKGRNLARDPRCSISVGVADYDVVVEGTAERVTDPAVVAARVRDYNDDGWPCFVDESGIGIDAPFMAASAGPAPGYFHRLDVRSATAMLCVEPGGVTRWDF
ncbi:MAG: pyridoxamine 5-phosphate oxidase-related FMN-binding protein [Frankiales bacterium]|nr:pyridoxamine 5-phosphate oxidase-related FMN-binding protein [Frankiales bacterium]